jgi:hypothetical protein
MKPYAQYLKELGATDEDVKVLDNPIARKAYEAAESAREAAELKAKTAADDLAKYDTWYTSEAVPSYKKMEQDMMNAKADAARSAALIKEAQERGLLEVAANAANPPAAAPAAAAPAFDETKYVTRDTLLKVAEQEGDAIALAQDIAFEHNILFPNQPLKFRELRNAAVAAKKPVEQYWMEKYGVQAARDARAAADKAAYEKKLREEGAQQARTELASQYGNPDTRPYTPSQSPFAARTSGERTGGKQPWEAGTDLAGDRITRGTKAVIDKVQ